MSSPNVFEDDFAEAKQEAEQMSAGIFLQKHLKDDKNHIAVAFIQAPVIKEVQAFNDNSKMRKVMCANVARFSDDKEAKDFVEQGLLELAPKHWDNLMARRQKFGFAKVYLIERRGKKGDTQVIYDCDPIRDLTPAEKDMLLKLALIPIRDGADGAADSEASWLEDYKKTAGEEWYRLGWGAEQIRASIIQRFGKFIQAKDMTAEERMQYLDALRVLRKGDGPEKCTGELDLDEEVEF